MPDKNIYTVDDFEEYLSELSIGTDDAQKLTEFVRRRQQQINNMQHRLEVAQSMIGEYELQIRVDYEYE